ncbi:hypothetical protein Taro_053155 [Colocasia esculenta]|uniref:transketolase n=1 Tax=Colocasia esculenta TaxID=4460 RepID=A0A843XLT1_COLES|nr:hypothetical protein [Colocasia esculenta]
MAAITAVSLHPRQARLPTRPTVREGHPRGTPRCRLQQQTRIPLDYKLSWREELKRSPWPAELSKEKTGGVDDDSWFQDAVDRRAVDNIRMLIVDAVQHAGAGHPGMALGIAEVGYLLYRHIMRYNPKNPAWFNRDRFVLSAGHGCLLQYVCMHLAGYESVQFSLFQLEDLKRLCKLGSRTPGHPENVVTAGIEVTTGPLGQGVANAVGLALAEAHLAARFNKPDAVVVDHRTYLHLSSCVKYELALMVVSFRYCIMGDGCAMEGISHEAASLAGHWKLSKLTLIYDDNQNTIDGETALAFSENVVDHFKALGWNTIVVDNIYEDMGSFLEAIKSAQRETERPTFIKVSWGYQVVSSASAWITLSGAAFGEKANNDTVYIHSQVKTLIGRLSGKEGTSKAHHGTFDKDDLDQMRKKVKWEGREPFHVVPMNRFHFDCLNLDEFNVVACREFGFRSEIGQSLEKEWNSTLSHFHSKYPQEAEEFKTLLDGGLPRGWEDSLPRWSMSDEVDATRGYSEKCLNQLAKVLPGLIGGSADLASSNKVYLKDHPDFRPPACARGRNIRYGVREHAMAGISNGIALHGGGLIPFAATFLVFSDYMKNAMRLSALSHAGVIYVLTHDSIGLGEDGPTHQPVEQLAGLRAIPRLLLFRPADGNETAGAYAVAVKNRQWPSVIALSRQKVAANLEGTSASAVERGGYVVSDNSGGGSAPEVILIGTGSELCLCEGSARRLRAEGRRVRVVSLVCWRLFDLQPREYREAVLPPAVSKRVSVEAGSPMGWREYVGGEGIVYGVKDFGASGAYLQTFERFGFTEGNVTRIARSLLDQ